MRDIIFCSPSACPHPDTHCIDRLTEKICEIADHHKVSLLSEDLSDECPLGGEDAKRTKSA